MDDTGFSRDLSFAMLIKHGWSLEQAKEKFGDDIDYFKNTFKCELVNEPLKKIEDELYLCEVCYCEYDWDDVIHMEVCGHSLCKECYKYHLQAKLSMGPEVVFALCPDVKCNMIIPPRIFEQLLEGEELKKYHMHLVNSFVDISKQAKWCPGKDCNLVCEQKKAQTIDIECDCGHEFCFGCTGDAHMPIDCELLQ